MNADLYLLVGEGELHWGFSVRSRGATARQKALIAPPPTSLVGALLFPLARLMGWGELPSSPVRNAVIGAYASLSPLIEFEDLMRSLALIRSFQSLPRYFSSSSPEIRYASLNFVAGPYALPSGNTENQ